jgi:hypothetical protein
MEAPMATVDDVTRELAKGIDYILKYSILGENWMYNNVLMDMRTKVYYVMNSNESTLDDLLSAIRDANNDADLG